MLEADRCDEQQWQRFLDTIIAGGLLNTDALLSIHRFSRLTQSASLVRVDLGR